MMPIWKEALILLVFVAVAFLYLWLIWGKKIKGAMIWAVPVALLLRGGIALLDYAEKHEQEQYRCVCPTPPATPVFPEAPAPSPPGT